MLHRLQPFFRGILYVAALILLPGALIGAPILWWINHRNGKRADQPSVFDHWWMALRAALKH